MEPRWTFAGRRVVRSSSAGAVLAIVVLACRMDNPGFLQLDDAGEAEADGWEGVDDAETTKGDPTAGTTGPGSSTSAASTTTDDEPGDDAESDSDDADGENSSDGDADVDDDPGADCIEYAGNAAACMNAGCTIVGVNLVQPSSQGNWYCQNPTTEMLGCEEMPCNNALPRTFCKGQQTDKPWFVLNGPGCEFHPEATDCSEIFPPGELPPCGSP